jgi:SAM-dependent methyltransferase
MTHDYRQDAVQYYDKFSGPPPGDVAFYRAFVNESTRVLELGCGTGRVMIPLAQSAAYVHGLDHSPAMLEVCRKKLAAAKIGDRRAGAEVADIADFDLTPRMSKFDLIIAPFRVMQNLETDAQVAGLMRNIKRHLARDGVAILNTFCPRFAPAETKTRWALKDGSEPAWIEPDGDDTVSLTEVCPRFGEDPFIIYPELTYRRYDAQGALKEESTLKIAMRFWYPDQLLKLVESHGFVVMQRFGGYEGEPWGEGTELVVVFQHADPDSIAAD